MIAASEKYLVHSQHAADMARRDASPDDATKITVVPFAFPEWGDFAGGAKARAR